jgi:DNA-binding NarL/FixJ family response regulator
MNVRVVVADDQALVRDGLRLQLRHAPGLEMVGEASDGEQAVAVTRRLLPDVVLMDLRMPRLDGIEATAQITGDPECASVRVLVLTTFDLDEYVYAALRAGAAGFLLKDTGPEDLRRAIQVVADGGALLEPQVTRRLIEAFARLPAAGQPAGDVASLTARETEVLALVGRGLSNAEVAERLVVSSLTVKTHVSRILSKLGLRDRAQLVVAAYESGLVVPGREG